MIRYRFIRCMFLLLAFLFALLGGHPVAARPATISVRVDPNRTLTLNGNFVGLGAEDDSNLLWSRPNRAAGAQVPIDIDTYIAPRLRALSMHFVRKFIDVSWFAPTPNGYSWDSPAMQALYANLAIHHDSNTKVMLTIWSLPPWFSDGPATNQDTEFGPAVAFPDPAYEEHWAELTVDLVRHLHGLDGSGLNFTNVVYVGGPNELAGINAQRLVRPFTILREHLAQAGLSGRVATFGPDSFVEEVLVARDTPSLDPLLDLYDFHYYAAAPVEVGFVAALDRLTTAIGSGGKQIWLTEFGEITAKNDDWRTLPIFAIDGINHGLAGLAVWNVQDQIYNTSNMPAWGLWNVYDSGYALKPSYYAWQMMAAHLPENATVYGHTCDREQCSGVRLAVLGDATGALTVIAYNMSNTPQPIMINLNGLRIRSSLGRYILDPAVATPSGLTVPRSAMPLLLSNVLYDTLPSETLVVYATDRIPF